jgi:hypothetical protein
MVKAVDMLATTAVNATDDTACMNTRTNMNTRTGMDTCTDMLAASDASNVRAAKAADMTDTNATQTADVSTAAKATDMTAAEATAHTARMAAAEATAHTARMAAAEAAATAAARHRLPRKQTRCQQCSRENGHYLFHHFLHSVMEWRAPLEAARHQSF